MEIVKEVVTPKKALMWLENAEGRVNQRGLSMAGVKRYAGDMKRDDWHMETADTIKLAERDGVEYPIDGQHRLHAIVKADKRITLFVARYVPDSAFQYLDQGVPRSLTNLFQIRNNGWATEPAVLSSTGRSLWKRDMTGSPSEMPAGEDRYSEGGIASHIWEHYPDLPEVMEKKKTELKKIQSKPNPLGGKAWMLYLYYEWSKQDETLANEAFEYLANYGLTVPPNLNWHHAAQYVLELREGMKDESGKILKTRNKDLSDWTMQAYMVAWNLSRTGRGHTAKSRKVFNGAMRKVRDDHGDNWVPEAE